MAKITIKRLCSSPGAEKPAPLYAVFNINRQKVQVPLKMSALPSEWDSAAGRFRGRTRSVKDKNLVIENVISKITEILIRSRLSDQKLTPQKFPCDICRPRKRRRVHIFRAQSPQGVQGRAPMVVAASPPGHTQKTSDISSSPDAHRYNAGIPAELRHLPPR